MEGFIRVKALKMGKFTVKGVSALTDAGIYGDGDGLYLRISGAGARSWVLRTKVRGRRIEMGLGSAKLITLAEARAAALHHRGIARRGGDPLAEKRKAAGVPTFEAAAKQIWRDRIQSTGKNHKHVGQWLATLDAHAFPVIGHMQVDQITSADVLRVLSPIWLTIPETAKRTRQRMSVIFDWAIVAGHRPTASPMIGVTAGLPKQTKRVTHHRSLPWQDVPAFLASLATRNGMGATALSFLVHTALRSGEVRGLIWGDVDLDASLVTIPAERMKARREFRLPLTYAAREILERVKPLALLIDGNVNDQAFVFPGAKRDKPLSDMSLTKVMRSMKVDAVPHGFRSSARTFWSERSGEAREVLEMCLAHDVGSAVEQAYARSDLFERRVIVMQLWSEWCSGEHAATGDVVPLVRTHEPRI